MNADDWTTVPAKNKKKRDTSHYIKEREADALEKKLDIINLSRTLTGKESRLLQDDGWRFERVIRGNDPDEQTADTVGMQRIPIEGNIYGDEVLFTNMFHKNNLSL